MKNNNYFFLSIVFISAVLSSCSKEKTNDLIPFSKNKKWGYSDKNGNTVISKQFSEASFFSAEGLAPAADEAGKWGFIDSSGTFVISPQYDEAHRFSEGLACVEKGTNWGFINVKGETIIPHLYSYPGEFTEGFACVALGEVGLHSWGYIDKTGKELTGFNYTYALPFKNGLAAVNGDGWNFINSKGESLCSAGYEPDLSGRANEMFFQEGLARVKKDGLFGFIDNSCSEIIPFRYNFADNFSDGMAAVNVGEKWGYIDLKGNMVIEPQFINAWYFSEGLAPVGNDKELYGYIDKTGKEVLPITYISAGKFIHGTAVVKMPEGNYFLIDKTGKKISKEYDMIFTSGVNYTPDGMFEVWINNDDKGYIDTTGKELF